MIFVYDFHLSKHISSQPFYTLETSAIYSRTSEISFIKINLIETHKIQVRITQISEC